MDTEAGGDSARGAFLENVVVLVLLLSGGFRGL